MLRHFRPPEFIPVKQDKSIFLAGTIEMGDSVDWQTDLVTYLSNQDIHADIYNPRRTNWDASWKQGFEEPQFFQQVTWELDAMERADIIIMNILPESKSPVSLLELGIYASSGKLIVCCPDEFYRSGNVHIVCRRYNIPLFKDMRELLKSKKIQSML